jgi:taurine--2-oxoglutarate transaminase
MWSWSKGGAVNPLAVERAEGVYFYTTDGKRYLDFNSQLMSVNIGHSHPKVLAAMKRARQPPAVRRPEPGHRPARAPRQAPRRARARRHQHLLLHARRRRGQRERGQGRAPVHRPPEDPGRYRSYHGATHAGMQMTGDPRRWPNEPGAPGFIRVMDPIPYDYSFGDTDEERTSQPPRYLEEVITYEGPHTIAAMIIETVIGTNGILPPPKGWLQGLRALLDKHGILLICDEVMCGFGRTGKMFAFEHGDIVPDILTMAKGLTSSYLPLGAMGVRDKIADHFRNNVFWGGLTYNAHALCLATAEAVLT